MIASYMMTMKMTLRSKTNAGLAYLLPGYFLQIVYLLPKLVLWRVLMSGGANVGMTLAQMLTYTYMGTLLEGLINLRSPLTDWLYDGQVTSIYQRPMPVYGHVVAQTLGGALPNLLYFSLPMLCLAPVFGVSPLPANLLFLPSLVLCVSLGFAVDFLFACLLIRMMNARWLVFYIRNALTWLLTGSFIPFVVLPWNLGNVLRFFPFGSLGGAVLSVYTGQGNGLETILIQLGWNVVLWPVAILAFEKSRERLVSHGG